MSRSSVAVVVVCVSVSQRVCVEGLVCVVAMGRSFIGLLEGWVSEIVLKT